MHEAVAQVVTPLLEGIDRELGNSYAAVLYGSGARGEFQPGLSDVNLLLVCESLGPEALRRLSGTLQRLRAQRQPPPLLMEREEWARAADVFPIEVTDMQLAHQMLRGGDPLAGMRVDRRDLRHALEQEFRAKLLRLRQAFALQATDARALGEVAARSVASVAVLFRVALSLHGRPVPPTTPECLTAAGAALGVATGPVASLWQVRRAEGTTCSPEVFEGYLAAVAAAVRVIDQFFPGGN
jgi:predicted nucleotidyltransferase